MEKAYSVQSLASWYWSLMIYTESESPKEGQQTRVEIRWRFHTLPMSRFADLKKARYRTSGALFSSFNSIGDLFRRFLHAQGLPGDIVVRWK